MLKPSLQKDSCATIWLIAVGIKELISFSRGNSLKVNAITQLEFELANYNVTVPHINCYTVETLPPDFKEQAGQKHKNKLLQGLKQID